MGAGVVIAQSRGERDVDKLRRAIGNTAALALAGGVVLALLGWLLAPGYLRLIRTPEEIRANAEVYLRIYFLSLPSIIAYNFGAGMLRALALSMWRPTGCCFACWQTALWAWPGPHSFPRP